MSRYIDRPVSVVLGAQLRPVQFTYSGERHIIKEVLETFVVCIPWWESSSWETGPVDVTYWRVLTTKGGVFDLAQKGQEWRLDRIWD